MAVLDGHHRPGHARRSSPATAHRSAPESRRGAGGRDLGPRAWRRRRSYVAPGDLDQYYMFASGGHSGNVYVYGVPSMRHISTIPVFTPYPATGYGFDDDSKKMLGESDLGRRAPPRPLGDQRRLRRALAVRQRDERPHRADRSPRLQDEADPRPGAQLSRQPRLVVRHAEHGIRDDGQPLLASRCRKGTVGDRQVRHRVQGRHRGRQDRPEERRDDARAGRF